VIIGVVSTQTEWKEVKSDSAFGNERWWLGPHKVDGPKISCHAAMKGLQKGGKGQ